MYNVLINLIQNGEGIILDWSDQQLGGLEAAVGKEAAEQATKSTSLDQ